MEATEDLRILVAVDGSEHSERAARHVGDALLEHLEGRAPWVIG